MSKVQLAAQLSKISSRKDRSYSLVFDTRELSGKDAATLLGELQNEGWLLFSPNELNESDVPDEKADAMLGTKTQAQRLRGVIYKIWEQYGSTDDFETYYRRYMEQIIEQLKAKLD